MPVWLKGVLLSTAIGTVLGTAPSAGAADAQARETRDGLLYLLRQDCGSCHGMTMKGGLGPALLPDTLKDKPDETLVGIILDGVPETPMPPWRPLLAPEDAAWIVKQLKKGL
ncbi:MAG: cytochrome c [Rhodospirillales bacterium]|nr:cytochrome c [Alphaproteobacteria bacterium]MBL6948840.1 cytochrome c [Rhodospirillales bacterium]